MSVTYHNALFAKLKSKSEKIQNSKINLSMDIKKIIFSWVKIGVESDGSIYSYWKCVLKKLFAILKHNPIFTVNIWKTRKRVRDTEICEGVLKKKSRENCSIDLELCVRQKFQFYKLFPPKTENIF